MLRIRAFRAVRPIPRHAVSVASVPYDVVSTVEAKALADGNPASFLHVIRPEIGLPPETGPYDDTVYETARVNLQRLIDDGYMERDSIPRMFLYRQVMDHRSQVGLVCCCHVDDYSNNVIRKHEKTRQDKEDDRTRHVLTSNANTGPVFLTFRDQESILHQMEEDMNERPLFHFNAGDDVTHTGWTVLNPQVYADALAKLEAAYVADGHHRSASAARAGAERRAANPHHTGDEEYNWFLAVLFPASQLRILAYNRVVKTLNGLEPADVLERLRELGTVTPTDDAEPDRPGVFCVYLDSGWHRFELDPARVPDDPVRSLDVSLLEELILGPILGIGDIRTDPNIDFVGGIRGTDALSRRVDDGDGRIAFSMYPTSIDQLLTVSDAGRIMPPKSTWFEPKLRSGLFVHELD